MKLKARCTHEVRLPEPIGVLYGVSWEIKGPARVTVAVCHLRRKDIEPMIKKNPELTGTPMYFSIDEAGRSTALIYPRPSHNGMLHIQFYPALKEM